MKEDELAALFTTVEIITVSDITVFLCVCVLYQLLRPDEESTSTQRYIDSRTVPPKAKGAWISVDVTETIKDWVSDPGLPPHNDSYIQYI